MLEVYGMTYKDMDKVSHVSYTDAVSLLKDNNAQLFTLGTTVPASSIMDLASARDISLIEVPDDKYNAMRDLNPGRSEEHTSELKSLMRTSYDVFCLHKKNHKI